MNNFKTLISVKSSGKKKNQTNKQKNRKTQYLPLGFLNSLQQQLLRHGAEKKEVVGCLKYKRQHNDMTQNILTAQMTFRGQMPAHLMLGRSQLQPDWQSVSKVLQPA